MNPSLQGYAAAVLETFEAIASNPHRLGKPLRLSWRDADRRAGPYRVVYRIDDEARVVSCLP